MAADAVQRQDRPTEVGGVRSGVTSTRAVERALELLEFVARSSGGRLSDLARATGIPTSTALRLLRTLEGAGFVRREEGGAYHPGPGLLALIASLDELPLVQVAHPRLRALVEQLGETANLGVLDENADALYIDQVQSSQLLRYASWRGRRVPGDDSALGLALHGQAGPRGYVVHLDAVEAGVTAVAAPVRGPSGQIVAALSVTGPTFRLADEAAARCGAALVTEAEGLSAELGAPAR
jgi:IclR family acetate operon transcriptional repressor